MVEVEAIRRAAKSRDRLELWRKVFSADIIKTICEVGVYKGEFAEGILRTCPAIEQYYMIDPWRHLAAWNKPANKNNDEFEEIFSEAMARTEEFASRRIVLRNTTSAASQRIPDGSLDCVYIDGDHTLRGITIDLIHMLPKVRAGGLIGGDDFTKNIWQHGADYSPTEVHPYAVYFAEAMNIPIITLPFNQFCILNDRQSGFQLIDLGGYGDLTPRQVYWPRYTDTAVIRGLKRRLPESIRKSFRLALGRR